ncbi:putative saccharopine dehydrogenase, NADP binding domain, NAD(P)-binding domain superfamily [Helianthus annuus]|uniref:Putative NAD(P)-binding domain-containing protein n=1 Tax=Helianthus annuus TaxID=4232 RepID=A0A251RNJ2_HELAN|nr:putative saccharopine dehydrogenase, NADP binding domain, NAD(P)-binding domain superfamily [Helianthus annuus]KAJ0428777.1 putative saccharopine dehydrogenase, NADP binding domain, NAD(P)-binding domain superfamily [Helianthus annuus]KAJ0432943.1 putative saccharopine dehydrogenase, NADP binding domain, NAD(P)-binding domain superfamily [Helianthus annuus]KAJ0447105.1 putative saccharopine dehydrogenase, NADP binding domain, NAD(P)-binding domain superfamily [Helianthus annuus]KAJ0632010.1 
MQKPLHLLNRSFLIKNSSIFKRTNHNVPSSNMKHDLTKPTYDVVIFGASGFTGKYVVKEALKFLNSSPNSPLKTLALAGRNHSKLSEALAWATPSQHTTTIPFLLADTNDPPSLRRMVSQAKLILNCAGPFRHHGGPVVDACVEAGCDYLDICGESEFMERMEALYHQRAVENGSNYPCRVVNNKDLITPLILFFWALLEGYNPKSKEKWMVKVTSSLVISACGIDSIPAELGFLFNSKQWVSPAVVSQVEAYMSLESDVRVVANSATYESAVLGVAEADKLRELRRSRGKTIRPLVSRESMHNIITG